jgi:hypothetical protein
MDSTPVRHPYEQMPPRAFWSRSVRDVAPGEVDPVGRFDLTITPGDKVATAGSCFAQHIARHLDRAGFNYHITEQAHPILAKKVAAERQYGLYSARYGNIYTTRQLHQLLLRAYGRFSPAEDAWVQPDGRAADPFRPTIEPGGFGSEAEMRADRRQHLAAVRHMLETLDVFIFTLGLTECWVSREDGAVFPVCPGVSGGTFDPARHVFHNLTVDEVVADMRAVIAILRGVNPKARVLLTVSPVPLAATGREEAHVLAATAYSKAVLRVAAETLTREPEVYYFPSYEIITGAHSRGAYYAPDLRNVTEAGVEHVMRKFLKHATNAEAGAAPVTAPAPRADEVQRKAERWVEVMCDEEALDPL